MKKTILLTLLIAAVYLLHQDFWNWKKIEPLVLGFLPGGLACHVGCPLLAALTSSSRAARRCRTTSPHNESRRCQPCFGLTSASVRKGILFASVRETDAPSIQSGAPGSW